MRDLFELLSYHLKRYPEMEVQDVYKLLYQGAIGGAHILDDRFSAFESFLREFATSPCREEDAVIYEPASPLRDIFRVHIAPYRNAGGVPYILWREIVESARIFPENKGNLLSWWSGFRELVRMGRLPFDIKEVEEFSAYISKKGFPPVHHSGVFVEKYKPSYRLIYFEFIKDL
ncbi:hypothetical protein J7K18_06390 [bacterium]|nr:hypothetical protein [bacterium]